MDVIREQRRRCARTVPLRRYERESCVAHTFAAAPGLVSSSGIAYGMRNIVPNPFEDADALYRVIANHEGQHSLWPAALRVPEGWTVVHDTDSRSRCIEYVENNWSDMRPKSLLRSEHV
jgi:MbtH protein